MRRLANINGAITDGAETDGCQDPVEHWVEERVRLVQELRFDGFVCWAPHPAVLEQTERFATEVVPAVRDAVTGART